MKFFYLEGTRVVYGTEVELLIHITGTELRTQY